LDITETRLFKEYPRVAPVADTLGFSVEDVELLLSKIENDFDANRYFNTDDMKQNTLRAIFVRINLRRNEFFEHIKTKNFYDDDLSNDCGKYNVMAYRAILK
jgi:hypothetical protein